MRRLRLILFQFIKEYKKLQGLNDNYYTLFEKYEILEPEVISGIFKDPKYRKAAILIQSFFRMKLAMKVRQKL